MASDRARKVQLWIRQQGKIAVENSKSCERCLEALAQHKLDDYDPTTIQDIEAQEHAYEQEKAKHEFIAEMFNDADQLIGMARKTIVE